MADEVTFRPIPGLRQAAPLPGAEAFSTTPPLELLRQVAARQPDAVALAGLDGNVTYAELLAGMARVAAAVAAAVPPGRAVACLVSPRPQGQVGMLGCLVSGRVCLMLNPAEPDERLLALLAEAAPAAVLLGAPRPTPAGLPVLRLDEVLAGPEVAFPATPQPWNPDAPLSVHYTSGSSGRPKGIVLSARSTLHRALQGASGWDMQPEDAGLMTSPASGGNVLAFTLAMLATGGRLLAVSLVEDGAGAVLRLAEREAVTLGNFPPPVMRLLARLPAAPRALRHLRVLRMGAAGLPWVDVELARSVVPPSCRLVHTYASTEALILAQCFVPAEAEGQEAMVAAGPAQSGYDFALLDPRGQPVPAGEAGELVLRSPLLALGEWQGGRLVPGRMAPEPGRPGWRRFHTGDLLRVQPDGSLRVLGRADRQVKVNGVRIEPAEIEAVLRVEPGVADAAVVAVPQLGQVALHGFVVAPGVAAAPLVAALRQRLAAALPGAFRPARLTVLERLPTLPGGSKVDLAGLRRLAGG